MFDEILVNSKRDAHGFLGAPTSVGTWVRRTSVRRMDALTGTMTEAPAARPMSAG